MKIFRRFLMFLTPVIIIGLVLVFFPNLRPDITEFRELRRQEFIHSPTTTTTNGVKTITADFSPDIFSEIRFIVINVGKIRLAIRKEEVPGGKINPFVNAMLSHYGHWHGLGKPIPILIEPHRKVTEPPPPTASKKPTPASPHTLSKLGIHGVHGVHGAIFDTSVHDLPGGTRIDFGEKMLRFEDGNFTLDDTTVSAIDKPILIVLDSELNVEFVEELDEKLVP